MRLTEIHELARRFVPMAAADDRLYWESPRSWWPAHEIGHFLVATAAECRQDLFGIDSDQRLSEIGVYADDYARDLPHLLQSRAARVIRYITVREIAATSISQRLLRRSGHGKLADLEIEYTDEGTLECAHEPWCKQAVKRLLRARAITRLPATYAGLTALLSRKAHAAGTPIHASLRAAEAARKELTC